MQWSDVAAAVLTPTGDEPGAPSVPNSPARRLRDTVEPIATIGWWSRAAGDEFTAAGLDFFGGYVWGRAASLGPNADVSTVVAAFGVFDPDLIAAVLGGARSTVAREEILERRERGAATGLATATASIETEQLSSCARRMRDAMSTLDVTARPLFGGLRSLPEPDDPHAALWRCAEMVREHRGDGHLAASVAAGLDPVEMNLLTELWLGYGIGEYSGTRGFTPDRIQRAAASLRSQGLLGDDDRLTTEGRAHRDEIEAATDRSQRHLIEALGDDLDGLVDDLATVATAVIASNAAPADPRKRAAG